ncbi:MAG: isopenicillin N synthase family oxygenase [Deltaproteobacteria bacterium]|nr:isopenicillin N synthase family oxygenase [Deltaproteobacteria bacterium]
MAKQSIPVVNLNDFHAGGDRRTQFVQTVGSALVDIGFFALEGHGISDTLIKSAYSLATELFLLPDAAKQRYENAQLKGQRGYTSFGREHAKDAVAPDLKEFWHVGQELTAEHPLFHAYPRNIWPAELATFKQVYSELYRQLEACSLELLQACALYVGEEPDRFAGIARDGNSILRVIHYPPVAENAHPQSIRAAAHEDINLITLLCEATAGGLELLERDGSWRAIEAHPGQIIVDSGDMLQNITNGYFRSTTHRVVNPDNSRDRRFSMPFFVHPKSEASLAPLASCVAKTGGLMRYPPITAGVYLQQRLREIGLADDKTTLIAQK